MYIQVRSEDLRVKNKGIRILVVGLRQPPAEPDDHLWRRSSLALTAGFVGRDFLRLKALKVDAHEEVVKRAGRDLRLQLQLGGEMAVLGVVGYLSFVYVQKRFFNVSKCVGYSIVLIGDM